MKKIHFGLLSTFAYNTAIAGLLSLLSAGDGFAHNFIFAQCIGFSIAHINMFALVRMQPGMRRWAALCVTLPISIAVGLSLAFWLTGVGGWDHPYALMAVLIGLLFGIMANITFMFFDHVAQLDLDIKLRQLQQFESEKREMKTQLNIQQAQIEPHFLFATLYNVGILIGGDPVLAKQLLVRLNDWLRVSLARARSDSTTLDDEMDMLENYLQILKVSCGASLRWRIEAPENARISAFPPMLLQPLIENALRHSAEYKLGDSEIVIRADVTQDKLRIEVNGGGAGQQDQLEDAGLDSVRARLMALFGEAGHLTMHNNLDGGATATLEMPVSGYALH